MRSGLTSFRDIVARDDQFPRGLTFSHQAVLNHGTNRFMRAKLRLQITSGTKLYKTVPIMGNISALKTPFFV